MELRPFQRRFLKGAAGARTAVLSLPRGNAKTTLIASVCADAMTPDHSLFRPGTEIYLVSGSLEQSRRTAWKQLRRILEPRAEALGRSAEYRWVEGQRAIQVIHRARNKRQRLTGPETRLSVLPSSSRAALGLVATHLLLADEPGGWEANDGEELFASITTAQGKPDSELRVYFVGTLAPAPPEGWWVKLATGGPRPGIHVECLQARPDRWDDLRELRRVNPLIREFPESWRVLVEERDAARRDPGLRSMFMRYRANIPGRDQRSIVLETADWLAVCRRPVPPREGRPCVGVDMGQGRAWTAVAALWANGRMECAALAPGAPSIRDQERADLVPAGTYERLFEAGRLSVDGGRRVPRVSAMLDVLRGLSTEPWVIALDRFRVNEVRDAGPPAALEPRGARWSEASEDVRAFRALAFDGGLAVEEGSRALLETSLAASKLEYDTSGNMRLVKSSHNRSRDDVVAAAALAAGAHARRARRPAPEVFFA